jgi:hypothetical protein
MRRVTVRTFGVVRGWVEGVQTLRWYTRRLLAMTPPELGWRIRSKLRDSADRFLAGRRAAPPSLTRVIRGAPAAEDGWARVAGQLPDPGFSHDSDGAEASRVARWCSAAVAEADHVLDDRLSILALRDHDLRGDVRWNYEYLAGRETPMSFSPTIDYRDHSVVGDCKYAWEPSRHLHLVTLGRAYRYTGDDRYAAKAAEHLLSWIEQCPFGFGMQWRSPLELGIRLINWVWALELIRPAAILEDEEHARVVGSAYRHLWEITRKYSRYSSANNHLIGEAAGVYVGASHFRTLRDAARWREESRQILIEEIERQTDADGGNREMAMGYHLFALEFFLIAGLCGRNTGDDFPPAYWERVERMMSFIATFLEGDPVLPMYGDADDGRVIDFGGPRVAGLLGVGARLFDRDDFRALADDAWEPAQWLLGGECGEFGTVARRDRGSSTGGRRALCSVALPEAGWCLLQYGSCPAMGGDADDRIRVMMDCGALGFGELAAHGHADALSVLLSVYGREVLIDPGTYDYFTHPQWRAYFRGTRAHNTVVVDERDQSEMQGPFLWGGRAAARCVTFEPSDVGGAVTAEHDGYERLEQPVKHRRTVTLDGARGEVVVRDELRGAGAHTARVLWHFGEACRVSPAGEGVFVAEFGVGVVRMRIEGIDAARALRGSEDPVSGWVSRGYHRKEATWTVEASRRWSGDARLETRMSLEQRSV